MNEKTIEQPEQVLVYVYDPMCSWCYGFGPTWNALKAKLPKGLPVVSLLGGLAPDSDQAMPDEMVEYLKRTWQRIAEACGVSFNFSYWEQSPPPPRTTFIACRAVIAAEQVAGQGEAFAERLQMAYYQEAKNVWDAKVLADLAETMGFRRAAFEESLASDAVRALHDEQRELAGRLQVEGYPTLMLIKEGQAYPIAIRHGDADAMAQDIQDLTATHSD